MPRTAPSPSRFTDGRETPAGRYRLDRNTNQEFNSSSVTVTLWGRTGFGDAAFWVMDAIFWDSDSAAWRDSAPGAPVA